VAKNCYSILGVSRTADAAAIHSAFRTLARRYHPDTGKVSSPGKFREAVEAYETLRDPMRRRQHDIDLGIVTRERRPAAEPLFAPRHRTSTQHEYFAHSRSTFDDLLDEIIRFIDTEFESALDFY
jgi:curved DNA-binding protein CbpA